jgi:hypothetical protein
MDEKQSKLLATAILVLFVLFVAYRRSQYANSTQPVQDASEATAPVSADNSGVSGTTPGMLSSPQYMNGSPAPFGTIDVTVNPWAGINQNYMPLFGFVGVSTTAYQ